MAVKVSRTSSACGLIVFITHQYGPVTAFCIACIWMNLLLWQLLAQFRVRITDVCRRVSRQGFIGWKRRITKAGIVTQINYLSGLQSRDF